MKRGEKALNELRVFENTEFGSIRMIEIDDMPYFVGKDVAEILGYTNPSKALDDHVDDEDKLNNKSLSSLGQRGGWLINESGLYSLILSSKLPKAKEFKHWVTSVVLPSIRKTGMYAAADIQIQQDLAKAELLNAQYKVLKLLAENPHLQNVYPVADEMETEKDDSKETRSFVWSLEQNETTLL